MTHSEVLAQAIRFAAITHVSWRSHTREAN